MTAYKAPLDDLRFALFDVLNAEPTLTALQGGEAHSRDLFDAVLEEAGRLSEQLLAPTNAPADAEGCRYDKASQTVTTPKGFKEAFKAFTEGGWTGLTNPEAYGGQALPGVLGTATTEIFQSGNLAWSLYPLLSEGATHAMEQHGEEWQRQRFMKPIVEGRWTGTMCLTEPQAGSDLGLLKTRAEPGTADADGHPVYKLSGTKIFISAGEHDLAENIVHLVLARLPDAPEGSRGISMFIVPKFKVNADGSLGARNTVAAGAIEHKMGIHACSTCVMNFDGAEGYLIGKPHKGLAAMFTMMNAARLSVGVQGLALAERALQNSLNYARERLQSRALSGPKFPDKPADNLLVQPDVRRMLLTQRAFVEGSRALVLYTALQTDIEHRATDAAARQKAGELVAFLIPIAKGMTTELAQECTKEALQIYGGHGYIAENGMEQFVRDARIITLYEGTTGIQAADLLGRKILQLQGIGAKHFLQEISAFCQQHSADAALRQLVGPLAVATKEWSELTLSLAQRVQANPEELGAAATDYLYYSGYVTLAYLWARSVAAAEAGNQPAAFKQAKRDTAAFYFARILPRTLAHKAAIEAGIGSLPAID
ncbi:acyl-CoA dehydrogenase C-terminal domain-containing protein [Rhodanobacter denitrificans]|uniref:acyl-CoA dehydrogenase C-terminal domain-containing protein n=1 Tax=Rhodanobacter denitrificans TaxID=666685 RepID=UPI000260CC96|nr:acyl-CoA dehydrogenase C-terminal domain-containing protein [Rhodanobacter denitrificans]EIM00008.1 acyl-CoA dehydrogenase [Rhodanobacter denitrificans]UJM91293.1 acyl-CoA dehydrogenase C-terminal domain-containing protein [Rhodanobacter denitrificans]